MKTTLTLQSGLSYIYPVLDWGDDPEGAVITVLIGVVSLPLIFCLFWALTLLRDKVHSKLSHSTLSSEGQHNLGLSVRA